MLLNILQYTGYHSFITTKNYQAPNVPNAEVENSRTSCIFWSGKYGGRVRLYLMVASAHRHCRELVLPEKSS